MRWYQWSPNRKLNDPVWRENNEGQILSLVITDTGFTAIGIETEPQKTKAQKPVPEPKPASTEHKPRGSTKQSLLIDLLKRPGGATLAEIVEATGWQPHTVRGAMAGALKKKLGLTIDSAKDEARGRVYRLA